MVPVSRLARLLPLLLCCTSLAWGAESLMYGGVQHADAARVAYLGQVRPFGDSEIGAGTYWNAGLTWLTYEYERETELSRRSIVARVPGLQLGLGQAYSGDGYWLNLSASIGYADYRLSPRLIGDEPSGAQFSVTPQIQFWRALGTRLAVEGLLNFSVGPDAGYARVRLPVALAGEWFAGPEVTGQRGPNYRISQVGLLVRHRTGNGNEYGLSFGRQLQSGESSPYIGLEGVLFF